MAWLIACFLVKLAIAYCVAKFMSTKGSSKSKTSSSKREIDCSNRIIETFQELLL